MSGANEFGSHGRSTTGHVQRDPDPPAAREVDEPGHRPKAQVFVAEGDDSDRVIDLDNLDHDQATAPSRPVDSPAENDVLISPSPVDRPGASGPDGRDRSTVTKSSAGTDRTRQSSLSEPSPRMVLQGLAVLATLVCCAALLAAQIRSSGRTEVPAPTPPSPDAAQRSAERWLVANTSNSHVLVDQPTGRDLERSGMSAGRVLAYDGDGRLVQPVPTGVPEVGFLALSAAIRSHPSGVIADLISESVVVAQFGSGHHQVQIRQVVAGGMAASLPARTAAQAFRTTAGAELLANHAVTESKAAVDALRAGQVDASLLSVLATLAITHRFTIRGFPAVAGESTAGDIRRTAEIVEVDGRPIHPGDTAVSQVTGFFQAQVGGFHPAQIHLTTGTDPVLTIIFPLPALPA